MKRTAVSLLVISAVLFLSFCGGGANVRSGDSSPLLMGTWQKDMGLGNAYIMEFKRDNTWSWKSIGMLRTRMGGTYTIDGDKLSCAVDLRRFH